MKIVFFTHPAFFEGRSMPRFARMLIDGMRGLGHKVEVWSPQAFFARIPVPWKMRKWLGYLDQFVVFPRQVKSRLKGCPADTLFVFTDQALGPWLPLVASRPHVLHCHDFMALKSALGEIRENPTSWTGCQYQRLILKGFSRGRHFISVSAHTRSYLQRVLTNTPITSEVVYNQVAPIFRPHHIPESRSRLSLELNSKKDALPVHQGFLLHVGANVWYKNKKGVLEIYQAWRKICHQPLPLIMIGEPPGSALISWVRSSPWGRDVIFLEHVRETLLVDAYSGATAFLFPSLEEGFGWPIAEAMACGCPVITTNRTPMTEVGAMAACYIPRRPQGKAQAEEWAEIAARELEELVRMSPLQRERLVEAGLENVQRFYPQLILGQTESIYEQILKGPKKHAAIKELAI